MEIQIDFRTGRNQVLPDGMSICEIVIPALDVRQFLHLPYDDFHRCFGAPEGIAGDLLVFAGCCYIIDQSVPRSKFPDNWTRELEIEVPVAQPDRWNAISGEVSEILTFLTGDRWQIAFKKRYCRLYRHRHRRLRRRRIRPASAVCLFSGGLDSLVGAVDHLSTHAGRLILVGHYDLGSMLRKVQAKLAGKVAEHYPNRFDLIQARVGRIPRRHSHPGIFGQVSGPRNGESTLRSRSLVFLALGLYIAQQQATAEAVPLLMPENGLIALNPPLTHSRLGSCSTRTAHPLFLRQFQQAMEQLGVMNRIHNPFAQKTKGEVLDESTNPELLQSLAPVSVSCAHPTRRQGWIRRDVTHCGYCIPCIFRRAALHRVGLDQGVDYGLDICAGEVALDEHIASDLRAILGWIFSANAGDFIPEAAANRMPLPPGVRSYAVHVLTEGVSEVTRFFRDKGIPDIRGFAGI